ncbi:MAG TPA: TOMM precursor leader peptide-binding protein [Candidatus Angelobacter sp.]|jgi:bacteriocin biosynthesis cyclodehydratase domain-containing protein
MAEQEKPLAPHVLSIGSFGRAVVRHLHTFRPDLIETQVVDDMIALPTVWPSSFAVILASWRPVPHFCELLDQLSFAWNQPFIPMILDSTMLRIGPVVIPGKGSCWACWVRRYRQHDSWRKERKVLLEYYASHPEAGPKGYLEPFAVIAASRLAMILASLNSSNPQAGQIWQIDMITRETTQGTVVGIHDCPKCGSHRPALERGSSFLRRDLAYLWAQPSEHE